MKFQAGSPGSESHRVSRPTLNRPPQSGRAVAVGKDEHQRRGPLGNSIEERGGVSHLRRSICSSQSLIPASQPGLSTNGPSGLKSPPLTLCRCRGRRVQLEVRVTSHKYGHVFRPSGAKTGVSEANPRGRRGTTIRTRAGVAGSPRAPAAAGGAFVYCNIPGVRFGSPPSKLPAPFQGARAYLTKDVPVFMEPCAW